MNKIQISQTKDIPACTSTVKKPGTTALIICAGLALVCGAIMILPSPDGLPPEGQRVLSIAIFAIGLWCTEVLPMGVTGMLVIIALVIFRCVPTFSQALYGFSQPVAYFLIGVLTIGLAVQKSGLAERIARRFLQRCQGRPSKLYLQLLTFFPLLTVLLPSATTRSGILVHVYEQAMELSGVSKDAQLSKAIMMALNSINRLASTMLLTGGITPVVSAALVGGVGWTRWFILMSVPYLALMIIGAVAIYMFYRKGFDGTLPILEENDSEPLSGVEKRTALITLGASILWLTDALHHMHPALPALFAWVCFLAPGIGVLNWKTFEKNVGWSNFFVLATSLSLANAMMKSGAGEWIARIVVGAVPAMGDHPVLVVGILLFSAAPVRLLIPNITGFLAISIPIGMSIGQLTGLNPVLCGLVVMIAGDAVLYYPAQSASSLVVYERGYLSAAEIFRFGVLMTMVAFIVVLVIALPYWTLVGEPLF
jgi:solute carrier family 13 (sodium-dependent dicarboxylate transporter), member 2/3/5